MSPARRVRILRPAETDIADCVFELTERSPAAGSRFRQAIASTIPHIAQFPASGLTYPFQSDRLRDCRLWQVRGFENWLILYRETAEEFEVLRVFHGARDLDALD